MTAASRSDDPLILDVQNHLGDEIISLSRLNTHYNGLACFTAGLFRQL
jgi:hypothetical protein